MSKLSAAQNRALEWLEKHSPSSLHSMETSAGVNLRTLDSLQKRGFLEFSGLGAVSIHATVEVFISERAFGLYANITPAGRSALTNGERGGSDDKSLS